MSWTLQNTPISHQMEGVSQKQQYLGRCRSNPCTRSHQTLSLKQSPQKDKRTTPLTLKTPFSNLTIIYISLAPLPTNPVLLPHYQHLKEFFQSLFCSYPYLTHKFHKYNISWKCNYATWSHSVKHQCFCKERYCHYHT